MTLYALNARTTNARTTASVRRHPAAAGIASAVAALAALAVVNRYLAKKAERDNPPIGRFVEVGGVKLHYVDRGSGDPVVLLHGNGSMIEDFESSGLIEMASRKYRVIAFDRPGFGHSTRPRGTFGPPNLRQTLFTAP
jgi:alpha/beta hydrolase fold